MIIKVKRKHLTEGKRFLHGGDHCPLDLAILDTIGPTNKVSTAFTTVMVNGKATDLSRSAQRFVRKFHYNNGKNLKPFNFRLAI